MINVFECLSLSDGWGGAILVWVGLFFPIDTEYLQLFLKLN